MGNSNSSDSGAPPRGSRPPPGPVPAGQPKVNKAPSSGGGGAAGASGGAAGGGSGVSYDKKMTVEDFELMRVIGKGSFGKVMQVKKKDSGSIYALKVLKKSHLVARKQVAHTQTERRVLQSIDHPFIVSLRYAFQNAEKLYLVLDYFTGGELFFHLKNTGRFPEARAKFYAAELVSALDCLHKNNIIYRDLKPENILLDDEGHVKVTDFGLSKEDVGSNGVTHTFCGTPEYLAPEVIRGAGYGKPVDWWSLGTLLYEMLTGLPPFYNSNLHVMYEKIIRGRLSFPDYMSKEARSLLAALLDRDPKTRLGSGPRGAEDIKRHPFFADIDWDKLNRKEIEPPFKPAGTGAKTETINVDEEFKSERATDTPVADSRVQQIAFPAFTYVAPQSMLEQSALGDK